MYVGEEFGGGASSSFNFLKFLKIIDKYLECC